VDLLVEWQVSNYPINNNIIYVAGQIVTYQGVAYRASENITNADNVVIPADNPKFQTISIIFQNLKTGLQYRRDGSGQWFKSFEGEYASGYWRFDLDPA
jgi:hypothetical protein